MLQTAFDTAANSTAAVAAASPSKEPVVYSSLSVILYALGSIFGMTLVFISCCIIRRKKGRRPKYLGIYVSLFIFCLDRTVAMSLRVAMTQQSVPDLGTIVAHNMLFQAGFIALIILTQEVTLSWIDNCLKRISAFTPKVAKIIRAVTGITRLLLLIYTFIGVGAVGYLISDFSLLTNPQKSVGMMVLKSIAIYGNFSYIVVQTAVIVGLYIYMLTHTYFTRVSKRPGSSKDPDSFPTTTPAASSASSASEPTITPSNSTDSGVITPATTEYYVKKKVKPIQISIIFGTPMILLAISLLLLTKMAYSTSTLYVNQAGLNVAWFYGFSVLTELLCVYILIASAPSALYKLGPHPKKRKAEEQIGAEGKAKSADTELREV